MIGRIATAWHGLRDGKAQDCAADRSHGAPARPTALAWPEFTWPGTPVLMEGRWQGLMENVVQYVAILDSRTRPMHRLRALSDRDRERHNLKPESGSGRMSSAGRDGARLPATTGQLP